MITDEAVKKNKQKFLDALILTRGVVTTAASKCHIDRNTHYRWMREDEEYKLKVEEIDDIALDFSESALFKNIDEGKEASIFFHLKCKGKKRGYREKDVAEEENFVGHAIKTIVETKLNDILSGIKNNG